MRDSDDITTAKFGNPLIARAVELFTNTFGAPSHDTKYVMGWTIGHGFSVALEKTTPKSHRVNIWLPYTSDEPTMLEIKKYKGETGRHSNTYRYPGLNRGWPVLRLRATCEAELVDTLAYIKVLQDTATSSKSRS